MFKFFELIADIFAFDTRGDEPVGLKRLQEIKIKQEKPKKQKNKKEYKISELMKKTV